MAAPEALFISLLAAVRERLKQWNRGQGFASVRADWLKRAVGLGEALQVRLPGREISGCFQGLEAAPGDCFLSEPAV